MSDGIGGWLYAIFAVSLGVGAAELLAPLGELRRYVKYVASLVVALSLVAPLGGFLSGLGELTLGLDELALGEYDGGSGDAVAAAGIAAIEDGIADEVEARFGITVGVSVSAVCESDVYSVDSVLLSLPAESDEAAVCDYVRYISGCGRVEVTR